MTMQPLLIRFENDFTPDMDALRCEGWPESVVESSRDEFDKVSLHLVIRLSVSGRPTSMVRATRCPFSPLLAWSSGRAPLPSDSSVAELTRGVVTPSMRKLGLYRLGMLETVLRLVPLGVLVMTAAIEPEFPGRFFLGELGFRNIGTPMLFDDPPRSGTWAQCIRLDVTLGKQERWLALWKRQAAQLLENGYSIDSDR